MEGGQQPSPLPAATYLQDGTGCEHHRFANRPWAHGTDRVFGQPAFLSLFLFGRRCSGTRLILPVRLLLCTFFIVLCEVHWQKNQGLPLSGKGLGTVFMRFRVVDVTRLLFVPPCVPVTESLSGSLRPLQRIYAGSGHASRAAASPVQAGRSVALSAPAMESGAPGQRGGCAPVFLPGRSHGGDGGCSPPAVF